MNLKPCPFCGSHDIAVMREGKSDKNAAYRVVCRHCKTRGRLRRPGISGRAGGKRREILLQ